MANDSVDSLKVRLKPQEFREVKDVLEEVLAETAAEEGNPGEVKVPKPHNNDDEVLDESVSSNVDAQEHLIPRCQNFFFNKLLAGQRLWQRPPHNHCERCAQYETTACRIRELCPAVLSIKTDAEYVMHSAVVERAGGSVKAWQELRALQLLLPDLKKHVDWFDDVRAYDKNRQECMEEDEATLQLDYGGFTDSAGKKVSVWSATVIAANGRRQEHYDFFFDQADKKNTGAAKAKKDGQTGIHFLRELLSPMEGGVSMLAAAFPKVQHLILSGDTGNGFRAYAMLEELSTVFENYGYTVELSPLAPGHAWNRTDGRIAHMNTFLRLLKAKSRVFGAEGVAAAFHDASNPRNRNQLKYMARSHIFFRTVDVDKDEAAELRKSMGKMMESPSLDKGKMGVKGFLWFGFSVKDVAGNMVHMPGYALTREHPNPARPDNPTRVFTWRNAEAAKMCQACSDRHGGPIDLILNGCKKNKCAVVAAEEAVRRSQEEALVMVGMPLLPVEDVAREQERLPQFSSVLSEFVEEAAPREAKQAHIQNELAWKTTKELREVRAVHGNNEGRAEIWLYIPENAKKDKSDTKRRGYWLYPEPGKPRIYSIRGPLEPVQAGNTQVSDVAVFKDFPFTKMVQLNAKGQEKRKTLLISTDRPMTDDELARARNEQEINEQDSVDCVESHSGKQAMEDEEEKEEDKEEDEEVNAEEEEEEPTLSVPVELTDYEQSRLNNIRANQEALKALNLFAGLENNVLLDVQGRKKKGQLQRKKIDPVEADEEAKNHGRTRAILRCRRADPD